MISNSEFWSWVNLKDVSFATMTHIMTESGDQDSEVHEIWETVSKPAIFKNVVAPVHNYKRELLDFILTTFCIPVTPWS